MGKTTDCKHGTDIFESRCSECDDEEIQSLETALVEKDARIAELEEGILSLLEELRHARVFISSKEKMHPTGVKLYEETVEKTRSLLSTPTGAKERIEREAIKKHEEFQKFRIQGFRVAYVSGAATGEGLPDVVMLQSTKDGTILQYEPSKRLWAEAIRDIE